MKLKNYDNQSFDRGASLLTECLWLIVKTVFFVNTLPWPSNLKATLLRLFGAKIGNSLIIRTRVNITMPWRLTVGDYVWIGEGVTILSLAPVTLGNDVCISQEAYLCTGSHDYKSESFDLKCSSITIHDSVWVALRAVILPGSEINSGVVVAAGSVVSGKLDEPGVYRGNPAMMIR